MNKAPADDPHAGITHLGGPSGGGWRRTRAVLVHLIETGTDTFYIKVGGEELQVVVVVEASGGRYLRSGSGDRGRDDLLMLPECTRPIELDALNV